MALPPLSANLAKREAALLDDPNSDLEDWERHRILSVRQAFQSGAIRSVLGLEEDANRQDLKRAYFSLAKEFHPDRYFKRNPGPFLPILEEVFAAATQFVRTISDPRTVIQPRPVIAAGTNPRTRPRLARGTSNPNSPIIGIDLGTTNTSVSAVVDGRLRILPIQGAFSIPSIVAVGASGEIEVGSRAKEIWSRDPRRGVPSVKRILGRGDSDNELHGYLQSAGFAYTSSPEGDILATLKGEDFAMPQLASYLLQAARDAAEAELGTTISRCVLTLPVSFDEKRTEALRRAASLAHLEVVDFVEEPCAAGLANRWKFRNRAEGARFAVYDFGGGTFDFSVCESGSSIRVLATAGDSWLGGDDFDLGLAEGCAELIWRAHNLDLRNRAAEWQELVRSCQGAKHRLSEVERAACVLPDGLRTETGTAPLIVNVTRTIAEEYFSRPVERSLHTCSQALLLAGLSKENLSGIYLSGGTSHVPLVKKTLERYFQVPILSGLTPDFAVCAGAGLHAGELSMGSRTTLKV